MRTFSMILIIALTAAACGTPQDPAVTTPADTTTAAAGSISNEVVSQAEALQQACLQVWGEYNDSRAALEMVAHDPETLAAKQEGTMRALQAVRRATAVGEEIAMFLTNHPEAASIVHAKAPMVDTWPDAWKPCFGDPLSADSQQPTSGSASATASTAQPDMPQPSGLQRSPGSSAPSPTTN